MKNPTISSNYYQEIAKILKKTNSIFVITGAGISADSGLPTYRGIGGLYENQITEDGLEIEDALSIDMFYKRPEIVWKYIHQIISAYEGKKYNTSHQILSKMESLKERFWILTQNVDGFHIDAGSKNVIEIHGNIKNLLCLFCNFKKEITSYKNIEIPPLCPECKNILKPDVVLFGELIPMDKWYILERELLKGFDAYLIIGTTGVFPYIYEPVLNAIRKKIPTIEINPSKTIFSDKVKYYIPEKSSIALSCIWEYYQQL